jgi:hypothetical protein
MEREVRASGRFFELPDPAKQSGIKIHRWLKLEALGEPETASVLDSDERVTGEMCVELRNDALAAWESSNGAGAGNGEAELFVEQRFWYRRGLDPVFSGQPDFVKIDHAHARAFVINYKTGRIEADQAADNLQLRAEVVLLKANFPELAEISAVIVEPWVGWDSVQVRYSGDDLRQAENQILAIVDRTKWEADHRIAGPWCRHCSARAWCQQALDYVQTIPVFKPEQAIVELPRGQAGTALWEKLKVAKKLIAMLEETYTRILEDQPDALPGYILPERGKPRRIVPLPAKLKAALADYLTPEEIDGCATFWINKIEKHIAITKQIDEKEARQLVAQVAKDAIETIYDQPSIRALTKKEREASGKWALSQSS